MRRGTSGIHALIGVNKPCGMTSHDVVSRVRRAVGEKRVGHAGTLDPDASGVLVVGIGQATRLMGHLTLECKSYIARIEFGSETQTDDAEGELVRAAEASPEFLNPEFAASALTNIVGSQMQVPPQYSAISINGKRSYALARAGETVELEARPITIYGAQLIACEEVPSQFLDGKPATTWLCAFDVSKGTYIRSIARDLGRSLGSAAHISELCRTKSGSIELGNCVSLDELAQDGAEFALAHALDPAAALGLPCRELSDRELNDVASGKHIALLGANAQSDIASLPDGANVSLIWGSKLYGIWERRGSQLTCSVNFPAGIEGVVR